MLMSLLCALRGAANLIRIIIRGHYMESSAGVLTGAKMLNNCSQKYVCACICLPLVCSPISAHALTHVYIYLSQRK